jgi:hypothetical protein
MNSFLAFHGGMVLARGVRRIGEEAGSACLVSGGPWKCELRVPSNLQAAWQA